MAFTEALKAAMKMKNLRPVDIASAEVKAPYLSRLLNGKVKDPTWQKALAIIDALGMNPDEFYELEKQVSQSQPEEQ